MPEPHRPEKTDAATIGGTPRATKRPAHVRAPAAWTNTPVPAPEPIHIDPAADQPGGRDPVRYGDWELKGIAIDF
ncbi:MAG: DUF1674 domain-containing protein [Sphingopyxis macrogoltabida]|uniref:DUF1674 domain-containing protein n=1 Tax=Sphingopyxis macrogoltabida TaxID=33050 RepID=A0A2W5MZM6_SPHMC|nr:MAG: DUF1674 domain-containing protein [Sphingopyxis macrogoltabida]